MNEPQGIIARFDTCPNCGSTRRLAGSVAEEENERLGKTDDPIVYGLYQMSGAIIVQSRQKHLIHGMKAPIVIAVTDVCLDCGTLYAVQLQRGEATAGLPPQKQGPPRRHNPFSPS